jgi:septation ring formation regulator EzrA
VIAAVTSAAKRLVGAGRTEATAEAAVNAAREKLSTAQARVTLAETAFHEVEDGDDKARAALKKARDAETDARDDLTRAERGLAKVVAERCEREREQEEAELAALTAELDGGVKAAQAIVNKHAPALIKATQSITTEIRELAARMQTAGQRHAALAAKLGKPKRFGAEIQPRTVVVPTVREAINRTGARHNCTWLSEL